jgi:hypothetical protein
MTHFLAGEHFVGRRGEIGIRECEHHRKFSEIGGVLRSHDQLYTRHRRCRFSIGDPKLRKCMRRTQHTGVQSSGRGIIGHETAVTAQQRVVFLASESLRNTEFQLRHGHILIV